MAIIQTALLLLVELQAKQEDLCRVKKVALKYFKNVF